jgi:hypothetical protein
MSNDNVGWELDTLGRQLGSYKGEVLDLESRVDWSERFVSQHDRDIRQIRYEAAKVAQQLQGQIQEHAQTIKGLRRFVGLLAKAFFAVIGAFSAWLGSCQTTFYPATCQPTFIGRLAQPFSHF